jgi:glycine betaine/proline transport system permease protein
MANTNWLTEFPELERPSLVAMRKFLDGAYRDFSRTYGDAIEQVFDPLLYFLVWFEKLLLAAPWPIVLLFLVGVTHVAARSFKPGLPKAQGRRAWRLCGRPKPQRN